MGCGLSPSSGAVWEHIPQDAVTENIHGLSRAPGILLESSWSTYPELELLPKHLLSEHLAAGRRQSSTKGWGILLGFLKLGADPPGDNARDTAGKGRRNVPWISVDCLALASVGRAGWWMDRLGTSLFGF